MNVFLNLSYVVPTAPRDIRSEIQPKPDDSKTVGVLLKWKHPQNTSASNRILKYVVTINRLNFKNTNGVIGSSAGGIPGLGNSASSIHPHSTDFNGTFFNSAKLRSLAFPANATSLPSYELPGVSKTLTHYHKLKAYLQITNDMVHLLEMKHKHTHTHVSLRWHVTQESTFPISNSQQCF